MSLSTPSSRAAATDSCSTSGFALPLAMFTIAVVAMIFVAGSQETRSAARLVGEIAKRQTAELAVYSAEQSLIYTIVTSPVDRNGLHAGAAPQSIEVAIGEDEDFSGEVGVIPLDGTSCELSIAGQTLFVKLQDAAGLIDLNSSSYPLLKRLFEVVGVDAAKSGPFAERLLDYIEYKGASNIRRLNGASAEDYARAGLQPPTNSPLRAVAEAQAILGFAAEEVLWKNNALAAASTVAGEAYVNPNTAPQQALQVAFGLSDEGARRVISGRKLFSIGSLNDVERLSGEPMADADDFAFRSDPGRNMVLEIHDPTLAVSWVSTLVPSPEGKNAPYEISERRVEGRAGEIERPSSGAVTICPTAAQLDP